MVISLLVANNMVGYVIGGIGAVMTAFCALFISIYCTSRYFNQRSKTVKLVPISP